MGFRYEPRQYKLLFEDGELKGLEVITGSVTVAEYNAVEGDEALGALFGSKLVSWNLEGDDGPVPATYEQFLKQDISFARELLMGWFRELTGASGPLPTNSSDTQRSVEASLATATSLPSQQS